MDTPEGNPLVSVIVPIYNVAPWLRKCLESLRGQMLKQIEVIMIDDGSTDESGKIAEGFVSDGWPQFRIIHHEQNRGLSAARNRGIDEARAGYIMFVDSDDWVEPEFCRKPYNAAIENQADMVIFGSCTGRRKKYKKDTCFNSNNREVGFSEAYKLGGVVTWNKLYNKRLFNCSIRYPEGRVYEDIAITHRLLLAANKIFLVRNCLYYHVKRKDSISKSNTISSMKDGLVSSIERYDDMVKQGCFEEESRIATYAFAIGFISRSRPCNDDVYMRARNIIDSISGIPQSLPYKKKVALVAWNIDERLFYLLSRITGRLKTRKDT